MKPERGRKKPTALKVLMGNPGKRALPKDEPQPEVCVPVAPDIFNEIEKGWWNRFAGVLAKIKVLTEADLECLEALTKAYSDWRTAILLLKITGPIVENRFGEQVVSPAHKISNETSIRLQKLLCEFGLTPASRSKVHIAPESKSPAEDPWGELARANL